MDVAPLLGALDALGGTFLVPGDDGWPPALDALGPTAPFGLWVRGAADLARTGARGVAVVGARAATTYGEHVAYDLAAGLAERAVTVVSGGAFGIDAAAHRGALARSGRTVVVLAGGVDRAYPRGHARLLEAVVADGGAVVSEVPVGSVPTRVRFLQRNRLIAGLATATVVVEAAWRSGAISTAYHASTLLRPVGAVPGPVTSVASAGCHRLLRSGVAVCVTDTAEVLELAGLDGPAPDPPDVPTRPGDGLPEHVRRVLEAAPARRALEPGALAVAAGVSLAEAHAALGLLELDGLVRREGAGWRRARP
ncbi:DNA-processing protein DprA [Cellulomonas sp. H30R-01]|uniref:DNA-processing protein DprA n=1 Tax=Cellulomonas sp. H30R-01 TaxID=2704467 RepID=UPI001EE408D8|nr:DNA-processing protein DprA [Cellulomonas sp. H30R-01]